MPKSKRNEKEIEMKLFKIYGNFKFPDGKQAFIKEIKAPKESRAVDKVYSLIGSQHSVKRRNIEIKKIEVS
ncbi:MAG: 50S ribosomal protein L18Ae [Candidatus Helarchaeota archaeon]